MAVYVRLLVLAILLSGHAYASVRKRCSVKKEFHYPIVINPGPEIMDHYIGGFQAWSYRSGRWQRIALQIDEKNRFDEYVLDSGLPFTANTDDHRLDSNDELVFSGEALGEDFEKANLGRDLFQRAFKLWKVHFCHGEYDYGSVLIAYSPRDEPVFFPKKVQFDLDQQEVITKRYRYRFNHDSPVLLGQLFLRNGTAEIPIVANSKFRMAFELPWWLPDFTLTEDNFKSSIESWQVGPIRTIVAVGVKLRSLLSIFDFHMFSELVFYDDYFQIPTVLEFPDSPNKFLRVGSGLAYGVGLVDSENVMVESNIEPLPKLPETITSEAQDRGDDPYLSKVVGPWGELTIQVVITSSNRKAPPAPYRLTKEMFGDSPYAKDWDWLSDMTGELGLFVDISNVEKGTYNFRLDLRLDSKADEGLHTAFAYPEAEWVTQSLP